MDNFIVSARKYRPATFSSVVGQSAITDTLKNAIRNNQIAQAFLFTGPRGVGKTTCARIFAKTINCSSLTPEGEACNTCPSCLNFSTTASFNIFELDAASNNSVDDIRTLVDQVRIPPQSGYKVYIIDEVHMLTQQAFNAFLKTLEEPPAYAKFILATTEKHKIIPTILSRCQIFDFRRINVEDIASHLQYVADSENIIAESEALHIIAQKADGALRDALSMFDQLVSFAGNQLTYKQVIENLNILDYEYYFKITDFILQGDISNTLLTINEIFDNGFEGQHFLTGLGQHLRNILVSKDPVTIKLMEVSNSIKNEYYRQAQACSPAFIVGALDILDKYDINYKISNNKKLHIEVALLQLCKLSPYQGLSTTASIPAPARTEKLADTQIKESKKVETPEPPKSEKPVDVKVSESNKVETPAPPNSETSISASDVNAEIKPQTEAKPQEPKSDKAAQEEKPAAQKTFSGVNLGNIFTGKGQVKETADEEQAIAEAISYGNEKVLLSTVLKVWPALLEKYAVDLPILHSTLSSKEPELTEDNAIIISIENALQEEEIFKNKADITHFLKEKLKNDSIRIETKLIEADLSERRPYTDTEKYLFIAEKTPALRIMKDQLGLELEM